MAAESHAVDLVAEFNRQIKAVPGGERLLVDPIVVDVGAVAVAVANAWAEDMRENMLAGKRPDGKGPMPRRKLDGRPRGEGTRTVSSIRARWSGSLNRLVIAADEDDRGTLARVLRGIPFRPPLVSARVAAVQGDAALIATMHGAAATVRGRAYSSKRLASWRAWQAKKTAKAASSGLGGSIGSLGGMLGK